MCQWTCCLSLVYPLLSCAPCLSHCWLKHAQARWCQLLSLKWVLSRLARHLRSGENCQCSPFTCQAQQKEHRILKCAKAVSEFTFSHSHPPSQSFGYFHGRKLSFIKRKLYFKPLVCTGSVPTCSWVWRLDPSWYFGGCGVLGNKGHSWKKQSIKDWVLRVPGHPHFWSHFLLLVLTRSEEAMSQATATDCDALPSHLLSNHIYPLIFSSLKLFLSGKRCVCRVRELCVCVCVVCMSLCHSYERNKKYSSFKCLLKSKERKKKRINKVSESYHGQRKII